MTGGSTLSMIVLVAVSAAAPHLLARGTLRGRLVRSDALSTVALLALWHVGSVLGIELAAATVCGILLASKIVVIGATLLPDADSDELDWSPARAGLLAGLVYLALIPQVLQWPVDGDESFYVLTAESILSDFDLDLRNQYAEIESSITGRSDLHPQFGDPVGPEGELYSRHEPLLSVVLLPGILLGGLAGAVATIALLAALANRAVIAMVAEEGFGRRAQLAVFGFVGLAPPFLTYALRIWPEAPGALLLAEMLRAARNRKVARLLVFGVLLSALKLRFIPIVAALLLFVLVAGRIRARWLVAGLGGVAMVLAAIRIFLPGILSSRTFDPLVVFAPENISRGLLGVLLDGQAGLLFQAPLFLVGLAGVLRWRKLGDAAKLGCLTALPYLVLLLPRSEWHGGWSPPLRYLVVFTPVFALLVAAAVERTRRSMAILAAAGWTTALVVTSLASHPHLFRIASGESALGEYLSRTWRSDFSRMIPSLIRPNEAAMWAGLLLVVVTAFVALRRRPPGEGPGFPALAALGSVLLCGFAWAGLQPGRVVEFEDAHVEHRGGELYPERWTVARFRFSGGWTLQADEAVAFRHPGGTVSLEYYCDQPTVVAIDGEEYEITTGPDYSQLVFVLPPSIDDRHEIRCVRGALILDRLTSQ